MTYNILFIKCHKDNLPELNHTLEEESSAKQKRGFQGLQFPFLSLLVPILPWDMRADHIHNTGTPTLSCTNSVSSVDFYHVLYYQKWLHKTNIFYIGATTISPQI